MSIDKLLTKACERCENYSTETQCEDRNNCPVYALYKQAKERSNHSSWAIPVPPPPGPEMI